MEGRLTDADLRKAGEEAQLIIRASSKQELFGPLYILESRARGRPRLEGKALTNKSFLTSYDGLMLLRKTTRTAAYLLNCSVKMTISPIRDVKLTQRLIRRSLLAVHL